MSLHSNVRRAAVILAAAALVTAGCSSSPTAGSGSSSGTTSPSTGTTSTTDQGGGGTANRPVNVSLGGLLPLTGDLAALGKNTSNATKLAVDEANTNTVGVKVDLNMQDAGTQESVAQSAVQTLLSKKVSAIVGAVSSAVCLSVIDSVVQAKTVMISPACTTPQLTDYADDGYFFRTAAPSQVEGTILAQVAHRDGKKAVAVLSINNSYGQSIAANFGQEFKRLGGQIVANVQYNASATSFTAEVQQVAAAKPDAVVLIAYVADGAAVVHDAAQLGLLDLQWYTGDGIQDNSFTKQAMPSDPQKLYTWKGIGIGQADSPAAKAFGDAYQKAYGEAAPSFSAQAYDAAWISILASIRAQEKGTSTKDEIPNVTDPSGKECIAAACVPLVAAGDTVSYSGATGDVRFDDHGDPTTAVFSIWQFGPSGIKNVESVSDNGTN